MSNPNWKRVDKHHRLDVLSELDLAVTKEEWERSRGEAIHCVRWHVAPVSHTVVSKQADISELHSDARGD